MAILVTAAPIRLGQCFFYPVILKFKVSKDEADLNAFSEKDESCELASVNSSRRRFLCLTTRV